MIIMLLVLLCTDVTEFVLWLKIQTYKKPEIQSHYSLVSILNLGYLELAGRMANLCHSTGCVNLTPKPS